MKGAKYFLLVFAICFAIPGFFFVQSVAKIIEKVNIVANGTEAVATVINYDTDVSINEIDYYYLNYEYEDANGIQHTGRTTTKYMYLEADHLTTIKIKYLPDFRSIEADYSFSFVSDSLVCILFIFVIVDVMLWVAFVVLCVKDGIDWKTKKFGQEVTATFVASGSNVWENGRPVYWIEYNYKNEEGANITKKSRSKYSTDEKRFFEVIKTFRIKVYKNHSVITEPIDISKIHEIGQNVNDAQNYEANTQLAPQYKRCTYCGSLITGTDKRCPCCGSRKFELEHNDTAN